MEVEGPIDERTLVERFTNKKTIVEGSVAKNTANKKREVDSLLFRLLGVETYSNLHI